MSYPMMLYLNDKPFRTVNSGAEHRLWAPQDFPKAKTEPHRGPPRPVPELKPLDEAVPIADPVMIPSKPRKPRAPRKPKHA